MLAYFYHFLNFPIHNRSFFDLIKTETNFILSVKRMKYISTRTTKREYSFTEAFLETFAEDGGLLCPKEIPRIPKDAMEPWSVGLCCAVDSSI